MDIFSGADLLMQAEHDDVGVGRAQAAAKQLQRDSIGCSIDQCFYKE